MDRNQSLVTNQKDITRTIGSGLNGAIDAWSDATTDTTSYRRRDLLRDKSRAVTDFFRFVDKGVDQVRPNDVKAWQRELEGRGLAPTTVYSMVSRISSFYTWARKDSKMAAMLPHNPVDLARPRAPRPYLSDATSSLNDDQVLALIRVVKDRADTGDIIGKRDYALILHFILTGRRRAEVVRLRWGHIKSFDPMVIDYLVKGGRIERRSILDPIVRDTLVDYLSCSGRLEGMVEESPLWTRFDRGGQPGKMLSSHGFVKNVKKYARTAGIEDFHLHRLRHTFARLAGAESGSLAEIQEALGHQSSSTTKIYLERVSVMQDNFSPALASILGLRE